MNKEHFNQVKAIKNIHKANIQELKLDHSVELDELKNKYKSSTESSNIVTLQQ